MRFSAYLLWKNFRIGRQTSMLIAVSYLLSLIDFVIQLSATEKHQNRKKKFNMTVWCIFKIYFIFPNLKLEQCAKKAFPTCTNPIIHLFYPPKFCIIIVWDFSWDIKMCQEKSRTMPMQIFWGYYGIVQIGNCLLDDDWHANLSQFQGARADHVRDENLNCSSPGRDFCLP